jgi:hypothetical protein
MWLSTRPAMTFKINLKTGQWSDFATTDAKGGDLISLFAYINSVSQGEAAQEIAERLDFRCIKPVERLRKRKQLRRYSYGAKRGHRSDVMRYGAITIPNAKTLSSKSRSKKAWHLDDLLSSAARRRTSRLAIQKTRRISHHFLLWCSPRPQEDFLARRREGCRHARWA